MTDFTQIAARLKEGNLTPDEITDFRQKCSGELYFMYAEYAKCLSFGAEWMTKHREAYKSQAECERAYAASGPGKEETALKYKIRGVEALETVLTSLYFQTNKEMQMANRES